MLYAHEVILNELAQGRRSTTEGIEWFESLPEDDQRKTLLALVADARAATSRRQSRYRDLGSAACF
ncbi:DUF5958 family protein [Streptomyces sp. OZ13]|uniref:DUF5958 family protein n=1 Tax=Streptomyces sp. OZ13 TaxID=3452210 RepID=UPI003F8C1527